MTSPLFSKFPGHGQNFLLLGQHLDLIKRPQEQGEVLQTAKHIWETKVLLLSKALHRSPWAGKACFPNPVSQTL